VILFFSQFKQLWEYSGDFMTVGKPWILLMGLQQFLLNNPAGKLSTLDAVI
jgi:hypothetical protein